MVLPPWLQGKDGSRRRNGLPELIVLSPPICNLLRVSVLSAAVVSQAGM
jgi:hypothetical protein